MEHDSRGVAPVVTATAGTLLSVEPPIAFIREVSRR
ncbi:hypothetical protein BH18ACI4_BH18ACI4_27610 [soil metagenome]